MKLIQRIMATALALTLLLGMLPAPAAAVTPAQTAETAPTEKPTEVVTGEGSIIEIGDDWETRYPYGAFAFAAGEAAVAEDGGALTVPVYRMGWAVAIGAISGMGDGTLAPGGTATRAQVAKIMQVFLTALR